MAATPEQKRTRPALLELTSELFSLVLYLRRAGDLGPEAALRQRVTTAFASFEREAQDQGLGREDVDKARFALAAFLDETVLDSDWPQREQWRDRPLQLDLYAERRAGQRFFDELTQLRRQGDARREVVEVYHQCLNLGFEGQYRVSGREQLAQLKTDLDHQLGFDPRDHRELKIGPHGKRRDTASALATDEFPFWQLLAAGAGIFVILFLIYYLWLGHQTGQALGDISNLKP